MQPSQRLAEFDWVVFSSANGVEVFLDRLLRSAADRRLGHRFDWRPSGRARPTHLARYHLQADLVPDEYRAESLAAALAAPQECRRSAILAGSASRGRQVLADELRKAGGSVEQVVAYTSRDVTEPDAQIVERLKSGTDRLDHGDQFGDRHDRWPHCWVATSMQRQIGQYQPDHLG